MNFIEICIGIGMNQFFPEYIKIPVSENEEEEFCPMCSIPDTEFEEH